MITLTMKAAHPAEVSAEQQSTPRLALLVASGSGSLPSSHGNSHKFNNAAESCDEGGLHSGPPLDGEVELPRSFFASFTP
jgi:hypothetical protein